ncbi:NPCBM/NEW2 domain-containing protein [Asticcacaulis endophyticus]|jgi:hypothetical protein|uniref:Alpha-galactosidase n=1 Tax=Asticcacaulis endophyticus TaxID=1395890 RepID=A0A918QDE9_9CAUL|nr:NPCBM/NEW2 domain-containing protein [Asticcacaulis endophyticus]GGZ41229.1 hypothetical protein GCM10011273_30020 [Asticcacaulis endophyticus]
MKLSFRRIVLASVAVMGVLSGATALAETADALQPSGRWTAHQAGKAQTPPMGWNSWNAFRTEITEEKVIGSAQALIDTGLAKLGYVYVNIDDGWWLKRRQTDGRLEIRTNLFPSASVPGQVDTTFRPFVDRIHGMGLKTGIYTDIGRNACSQAWDLHSPNLPEGSVKEREVGLEGHVDQDIKLFFSDWGFDYVKVDACGLADFAPGGRGLKGAEYAPHEAVIVRKKPAADQADRIQTMYAEVAGALKTYNPDGDYVLSICTWGTGDVRTWGNKVGNAWRTSPDISANWNAMLRSYDSVATRALYARPGAWNDPDMLFIGKGEFDTNHLTEARSHFSLWAMINAPLLIGYDLREAPKALLDIWGNRDLINVNQDKAGNQGILVWRSNEVHIIVKTLSNGKTAVALFNRSNVAQTVDLTSAHLKLDPKGSIALRDLWTKETLPVFKGKRAFTLAPHETMVFEAAGTRLLKNGVYLSEIPARVNVAVEGVSFPDAGVTAEDHKAPGADDVKNEIGIYARTGAAQPDVSVYGTRITVGNQHFKYGLGVFANSRIEVRNDGEFKRFSVKVGIDVAARNQASTVQFLVFGDGKLLTKSIPLSYGAAPIALQADIKGIKVIELITRSVGGGQTPTAANWAEAQLQH